MSVARFRRPGSMLAVALLATALAWGLTRYGGTETASLYRLFLSTAVAVALTLLLRPPRVAAPEDWVLAAIGLFLLLQAALQPTLEAAGYLHWALGWMTFFVVYRAGSGRTVPGPVPDPVPLPIPRPIRLLVFALIALGALEALYGLGQVIGVGALEASPQGHLEGMATGTFVNRNHYAGFLNLVLPLAVGALYAGYARRWGRRSRTEMLGLAWTALLASAFIGVAVLLSRSRGGTVTLVVTVVFVGLLLALGRRTSRRGLSSVASATLAGLILLLGLAIGLDALLARFAEIDQTQARLAVYRDTLGLVADEPLAGTGPGMYRWRFRPYQTADLGSLYHHAHNDYLETAAEWGVPVALAFWLFVLWSLRRAVVVALASKDPWRRGLALGVAGSIVSILLHSLFDFNLQIPSNLMVFAAVLAMARGVASPWERERNEDAESSRGGGAPGGRSARDGFEAGLQRTPFPRDGSRLGAPLLGYLLTAVLLLALLFAAVRTRPRLQAAELARGAVELADLERAVGVDPANPDIHFRLAIAYRDHPEHRDLDAARSHLERAAALNPHAWRYLLELSRVEELARRPDEAARALERAVELNPRRGDYRWRLANFHLRRGALDAAFAELGEAVDLDPALGRAAFHLLLKAGAGWSEIERLWPGEPAARLELLTLSCGRPLPASTPGPPSQLLDALWHQALAAPEPPPIERASFYVSCLLERGAFDAARTAWSELTAANGLEDPAHARGDDLVWNGGFELPVEPSRPLGPLDWRLARGDGFLVTRQPADGAAGAALRLELTGENLDFRHLTQRVVVPAGTRVRLAARMRSDGLTTENGLFLEVVAGREVLATTEPFLGTRPWTEIETTFTTPSFDGASRGIVELRLRRLRSRRIAGKIEGTLWLDDVRLERVDLAGAREVLGEPGPPAVKRAGSLRSPSARDDKRAGSRQAAFLPLLARLALARPPAEPAAESPTEPPTEPPTGSLVIVTQPGVEVLWDGIEVGETDAAGRLVIEGIPPGTYALVLSRDGFEPAARRLEIGAGENVLEGFLEPVEAAESADERAAARAAEPQAAVEAAPEAVPEEPPATPGRETPSSPIPSSPIPSSPIPSSPIPSSPIPSSPISSSPLPDTRVPASPAPSTAPRASPSSGADEPRRERPSEPLSEALDGTVSGAVAPARAAEETDPAEEPHSAERSRPAPPMIVGLALLALLAVGFVALRRRQARRAEAAAAAESVAASTRMPSFLSELKRRERVLERQLRQRRVIDAEASEIADDVESEQLDSADEAVDSEGERGEGRRRDESSAEES